MLGPILVTVLATAVHPVAGLAAAVGRGVLGTLAFAAQRSTAPPPHPRPRRRAAAAVPWPTIVPLAVVCLALGILFGAAEVTTVAFAEEQGAKSYAGVLLALWALGSLLAGRSPAPSPGGAARWCGCAVGALGMARAMPPLALHRLDAR